MSQLYLPPEVLEKMVCLLCSNYLSYFPIYTKKDTSGAICGRCKLPNEDDYIRDEAYERIAQFLIFPCMYKDHGCKEQLCPSELEQHEDCCENKKYPCPSKLYSKCKWKGPRSEIIAHFEADHPDLLLTEPTFQISFVDSSEEKLIFCDTAKEIFVVKKEVDARKKIFLCTVEHLKEKQSTNSYMYSVKAESDNKDYFRRYPERCTDGSDMTRLNHDTLMEELHDPTSVWITIRVYQSNQASGDEASVNVEVKDIRKDKNINWDLLAELECPVCLDHMLPPIFQCAGGHSICQDCRPKLEQCPLCKSIFQATQNFTLEKMTQYIIYPCRYYKSGCNHSAKAADIRRHETSCDFGPYKCPLSEFITCDWKDHSSKLIAHIDEKHVDKIVVNDRVNITFNKGERTNQYECFLIKFLKRCFILHYRFQNDIFQWTVQLVGPADECKKYRADIDLVDYSGTKWRCYLSGPVSPLTAQANAFATGSKYLSLTLDMVEPFIDENAFAFRVLIFTD